MPIIDPDETFLERYAVTLVVVLVLVLALWLVSGSARHILPALPWPANS